MENKKQSFIGNQEMSNECVVNETRPPIKHQLNVGVAPLLIQQWHVNPYNCKSSKCPNPPLSQTSNYQNSQLVQFPVVWGPAHHHPHQYCHLQKIEMQSNQNQNQNQTQTRNWQSPNNMQQPAKLWDTGENKQKKHASSTTNQQFRSPSAKRPVEATVTMQGWLHKQGSEGLKVWRKRWFVLSNYCLYYYKGPEEEKILGSILLPSYKVSLCGPDDKVYRKFAFKCEHANMRTYHLAADSQVVMMEWIRVLNLACLLQSNNDSDHQSGQSVSSMYNLSLDNSDSGFHQQYLSHLQNVPRRHMHSSSHTTENQSNPSHSPSVNNCVQPLYANAPPKPRRLTDGYSSPSPEFSINRCVREPKYLPQNQNIPLTHVMHYSVCNRTKSPVNIYTRKCDMESSPQACMSQYINCQQNVYSKMPQNYSDHNVINTQQRLNITPNIERRTPDTYGRSKINSVREKGISDYEDVYCDDVIYKRPLSPIAYCNIKKVNPISMMPAQHRPFTPDFKHVGPPPIIDNVVKSGDITQPDVFYSPLPMCTADGHNYKFQVIMPQLHSKSQPNTIPRPHSADFLEYEAKYCDRGESDMVVHQQPRPKSSLDINRTYNDNYYYSKESYADKMRKSALYLKQYPTHMKTIDGHKTYPYPNQYDVHNQFVIHPNMKHNAQQIVDMSMILDHKDLNHISKSSSALNEGFHENMHLNPSKIYLKNSTTYTPDSSRCDLNKDCIENYHGSLNNKEYHNDEFIRSVSARMYRTPSQQDSYLYEEQKHQQSQEGDRKREESMKRLLEWKQRMLQSPLNRKLSSNVMETRNGQRPDYYPHSPQSTSVINYEYPPENRSSLTALSQYNSYSSDDEASGSISLNTHETFPRAIALKKMWAPQSQMSLQSKATFASKDDNYSMSDPHIQHQSNMKQNYSQYDMNNLQKVGWQWSEKMNMSAGELLGRTYEELVLLLIQLRRQSTNTCHAIETGYAEIDQIQSQLNNMDTAKRLESLQKLEQLKLRLLELEKQYEKGKPLVNLVDNMVKLGSLYQHPNDRNLIPYVRNRLEFNQQIQERRLLAEERRDWNRLSPNHVQLQEKVQQLYQLDRLLQEESSTLQDLQNDKEKIEKALGGLRNRLNRGHNDPCELEQARKQQALLENELSRVHLMLAQNSKKLEETVAGNARLEQELLVLRQKLQLSRQNRNSPQFSNTGDSLPYVTGTSVMLESELHRVQQLVGDLQRQRQELSSQVRQLTDRSHSLSQQIHPCSTITNHQNAANKKCLQTSWRETDLDTMHSLDHKANCDNLLQSQTNSTPSIIMEDSKQSSELENNYNKHDYYNSDDMQQQMNGMSQEKQEIKTVRIVKRESERRQRDREKSCVQHGNTTNSGFSNKWDTVLEEDDYPQSSYLLHNENGLNSIGSDSNLVDLLSPADANKNVLNRQNSISSPNIPLNSDLKTPIINDVGLNKSPVLSPIFKSEAARQIIIEMSAVGQSGEQGITQSLTRRTIPKEKRRHYTAPSNNIMRSLNHLPTEDSFSRLDARDRRARDDLDMERALRQKTDTPDVVRSTLSNKELKYNENTIDNILGTPNKISIPERYIPENSPQLSPEEQQHRLRKVESIKKMLSDTAILSSTSTSALHSNHDSDKNPPSSASTATKMVEEKRQREHLLQLNQILAKQVMEMSKIVAGSTVVKDEQ